ncbi:uncharacterized protein [Nicotiana sylvestris]|uniref:uncharacterized protein n=1 Tax=Nicotiana sylvestris TaxID=4096 RepID=UPI00388C4554
MELLREFVDRFQRERIMLPRVPDNWAAMAFSSNLMRKFRSYETTQGKYNTKLRIEEDTIIQSQKEERVSSRRAETGKRSGKNRYKPYMGPAGRDLHSKQDNSRLLQGEVDHLLKQGYLTELFSEKGKQEYMKNGQESPKPPSLKRTVNVISGGEEINDADGILIPHNDALVIYLLVHDTKVKRVLIDSGCSVNIILLRVVNEMKAEDKLIPKAHTLSCFYNSSVVTKGEIILTTFTEGVVKDTKFQVVEMDMAYNMIPGRPWIHEMDAVPSNLYQVIKSFHNGEYDKSLMINKHLGASTP